MAKKLPAFQFYTGDWLKDPALRGVSRAAKGLWIDMLCLMHESSRRGYLQLSTGKPVTAEQLARMTGGSTDEVSRLLQELKDSGVYSCTQHGVIYSRRMVRDESKRHKCSEAGAKGGGNPTFKGRSKGGGKGRNKGPPGSSSSFSTSVRSPPPNPPPGGGGPDGDTASQPPLPGLEAAIRSDPCPHDPAGPVVNHSGMVGDEILQQLEACFRPAQMNGILLDAVGKLIAELGQDAVADAIRELVLTGARRRDFRLLEGLARQIKNHGRHGNGHRYGTGSTLQRMQASPRRVYEGPNAGRYPRDDPFPIRD